MGAPEQAADADRDGAAGTSAERDGSSTGGAGPERDSPTSGDAGGGGDAPEAGDDLPEETPPGPDGWPLVGNTFQFVRDPFGFYEEVLASHGDVVSWSLAGFDMVSVLDPAAIERVLVTEWEAYEKTLFDDRGVDFAPDGLVFANGEQWRNQRTLLQDVFTPDRIDRYAAQMVDVAEDHARSWPVGEEVALNQRFADLTLDVLSRTLLDVELDGERGAVVADYARALNERADVRSVANFLPGWIPTPGQRRYDRADAAFESMLDDVVAERRAADLDDRDDLLSLLLHAEGPDGYTHSERELRDQLVTFLFAGHDTTSLALTYACLLLAQDDDALAQLRAEWADVFDGETPAPRHVPELEFTDRVVSETLRLYPPALVLLRETTRDVELGGYRIPEGTKVALPQFHVHTDERFYDDPDAFRPDRWTDEFVEELPDYAYFPFGGGPRHCIGMRFARMELQLVLPVLLRAYDLELRSDPDPDVEAGATAHPEEDVVAVLRERA